jgi:hypothetical protein
MKWQVFKRCTKTGETRGWYALHESNGVGGLFVGPTGWADAMAFVNHQIRAEYWRRVREVIR